jgi:hypothetical protein
MFYLLYCTTWWLQSVVYLIPTIAYKETRAISWFYFNYRQVKSRISSTSSTSSSDEIWDDTYCDITSTKKQRKFCQELWNDICRKEVKELPSGLNGLASFTIRNVPALKLAAKYCLQTEGVGWKNWQEVGFGYGHIALESATIKIAHIKKNIVLSVSCNLIRIMHVDLVESMQIVFIVQLGVTFR